MANSANLPAPYGGQNSKTPIAVLKSPFCQKLFNFNTTEAGIELRNGDSKWCSKSVNTTGSVDTEGFAGFVPYDQDTLFMAVYTLAAGPTYGMRFYDISTEGGAPSLAYTSVVAASSASEIFTTYFNGRVYVYRADTTGGDYYDGSAWGSIGYTFPTISALGGAVFKNRQYFIGGNSTKYGYSGIDAVTGTVTEVDLGSIITEKANLAVISPVTIPISETNRSMTLLAFVFFSGEVLFYSGSYPDSDDWELVGLANMGAPLNYNAVIKYQGDGLVMSRTGVVSLRDLFLVGSSAALSLTVSNNIDSDWITLVDAIVQTGGATYNSANGRLLYVSGVWWKGKNRIVISFPVHLLEDGSVEAEGGNTYFVFDTLRGSWNIQQSYGVLLERQIITFKNVVLFSTGTVAEGSTKMMISRKEGATGFQDRSTSDLTEVNYDYEMLSAPIPFPKTAVYEATQIEPIMESDLYGQTNWNFVADFGRQTSGDQKTDASTTAVAKPAVNVGMQNITYVQVKMSGTTTSSKTVGLDLYSYNVWYDAGEIASR